MAEQEFRMALELELENATAVPVEEYAPFKQKALSPCPKGHEGDWPFLALALKLGCPLWSNDSALKKQSTVKAFSTDDLASELG